MRPTAAFSSPEVYSFFVHSMRGLYPCFSRCIRGGRGQQAEETVGEGPSREASEFAGEGPTEQSL